MATIFCNCNEDASFSGGLIVDIVRNYLMMRVRVATLVAGDGESEFLGSLSKAGIQPAVNERIVDNT